MPVGGAGRLHVDDGHAVRHDVVQLAGDPRPFLGQGEAALLQLDVPSHELQLRADPAPLPDEERDDEDEDAGRGVDDEGRSGDLVAPAEGVDDDEPDAQRRARPPHADGQRPVVPQADDGHVGDQDEDACDGQRPGAAGREVRGQRDHGCGRVLHDRGEARSRQRQGEREALRRRSQEGRDQRDVVHRCRVRDGGDEQDTCTQARGEPPQHGRVGRRRAVRRLGGARRTTSRCSSAGAVDGVGVSVRHGWLLVATARVRRADRGRARAGPGTGAARRRRRR